jgi:hypothetical protein
MLDDQCPMIIEHWTFCILHSAFRIPTRSSDARGQNREQLIALVQCRLQALNRTELHLRRELQPRTRFSQLLHTDPELVNEIAPGFRALYLTVIGQG